MTAKEKAKELYDKMLSVKKSDFAGKESALIAADEIIAVLLEFAQGYKEKFGKMFWRQVKEEIQRL